MNDLTMRRQTILSQRRTLAGFRGPISPYGARMGFVADGNGSGVTAGAVTGNMLRYTLSGQNMVEKGAKWGLDWGGNNIDNFRRPLYVSIRNQSGHRVARHQADTIVDSTKKSLKSVKASLLLVSFGVGTVIDIATGNRTPGQAVSYNGVGTIARVLGGGTGKGAATLLGVSNPIGWVIIGGIAVGFIFNQAYKNNWLSVQTAVQWVGAGIDTVFNWASDAWNSINIKHNFIDDVGQALRIVGEMINPFNWNWGN